MDRWQTKSIMLEGGLVRNEDSLIQGAMKPGSLIQGLNFEPGLKGGYRRISGFQKFDEDAIPGEGPILGLFIFDNTVVGCRDVGIYTSVGSGWSRINPGDDRSGAVRYRAAEYNWGTPTMILVDGQNTPVKYTPQAAETYTLLTAAPIGAETVTEFKSHIFFSKGPYIYFSQPNDDEGFDPALGAGQINTGHDIIGMKQWRNDLYVFHRKGIQRLTGYNKTDFRIEPVTKDIGCLDADTIQEISGDVVFLASDGIRTIAGTERIGDVELASISRQVQDLILEHIAQVGTYGIFSSVVIRAKAQYRVFITRDIIPVEEAGGVLGGLRQGSDGNLRWEWFQLKGFKVAASHSGFIGPNEYVVHGDWNGYVYRQEEGNTLDGEVIDARLQTPFMPLDDPAIRKTLYKLKVLLALEGPTSVTVSPRFDYEDAGVVQPPPVRLVMDIGGFSLFDDPSTAFADDDGTVPVPEGENPVEPLSPSLFDANPTPQTSVQINGSGMLVSFAFYGDENSPPFSVKSIIMQYALGGRR